MNGDAGVAIAAEDSDADDSAVADLTVEVLHVADVPPVHVGDGCIRRDLPAIAGVRAWIVEMAAGATWPQVDHHPGGEDVYVIDGDLVDGGRRHLAGTYLHFAAGSAHRPRTTHGVRLIGWNPAQDAPTAPAGPVAAPSRDRHRALFDFEIGFANGGGLSGTDFRLDIDGDDIDDDALARLLVRDLRLLMVATVRIDNKRIVAEAHKRR